MYPGISAVQKLGVISASTDGVLAPGSAHDRPSAQTPIDTSGNLGIFPLGVFFLPPLFKTTEGVVVGFRNFAWVPN